MVLGATEVASSVTDSETGLEMDGLVRCPRRKTDRRESMMGVFFLLRFGLEEGSDVFTQSLPKKASPSSLCHAAVLERSLGSVT
jgi:hypothetical protein